MWQLLVLLASFLTDEQLAKAGSKSAPIAVSGSYSIAFSVKIAQSVQSHSIQLSYWSGHASVRRQ